MKKLLAIITILVFALSFFFCSPEDTTTTEETVYAFTARLTNDAGTQTDYMYYNSRDKSWSSSLVEEATDGPDYAMIYNIYVDHTIEEATSKAATSAPVYYFAGGVTNASFSNTSVQYWTGTTASGTGFIANSEHSVLGKGLGIAKYNNEIYALFAVGTTDATRAGHLWRIDGNTTATYKNALAATNVDNRVPYGIKTIASDMYIYGKGDNGGQAILVVWKNGVNDSEVVAKYKVNDANHKIYDIAVNGTDIYLVGTNGTASGYYKLKSGNTDYTTNTAEFTALPATDGGTKITSLVFDSKGKMVYILDNSKVYFDTTQIAAADFGGIDGGTNIYADLTEDSETVYLVGMSYKDTDMRMYVWTIDTDGKPGAGKEVTAPTGYKYAADSLTKDTGPMFKTELSCSNQTK